MSSKIFVTPWRNSIFSRLLLTFLLILIPILAIAYCIYDWGIRSVKNELAFTIQSQVNLYLNNLQTDIQGIKKLQYDCLNDQDLKQLAGVPESLNDYERTQAMLAIQNRLGAILNSSSYIDDVSAFIPSIQKKLSPVHSLSSLPAEEYETLWKTQTDSDAQIIYWQGKLLLSSVYLPKEKIEYREPLFIVEVELSVKALSSMVAQLNAGDGGGAFLYRSPGDLFPGVASDAGRDRGVLEKLLQAQQPQGSGSLSMTIGGERYMAVYVKSSYLNMTLCRYVPEELVYQPLRKYEIWVWIFTVAVIAIVFLYSISTFKFIHQPLFRLVQSFHKAENGDFDISISHKRNDEFAYLYSRFNSMVGNIKALIDQVYKQKIMAQKAELKQLQSQINPHFLYNSFYQLYNMVVMEDYPTVQRFTRLLGNYFQFITRNSANEIPLSAEVEHARAYAEIQARRFRNRITVDFADLPCEYGSVPVPKLIIQPLIENAFDHGLENKAEDGVVRVTYQPGPGCVSVTIEDNGCELSREMLESLQAGLNSDDGSRETTGIINVHRRIRLMFGERFGLTVERSGLGGLRATVTIPASAAACSKAPHEQ